MWTIIKINVLNPASMEFMWDFSRFWYLTHNDYYGWEPLNAFLDFTLILQM